MKQALTVLTDFTGTASWKLRGCCRLHKHKRNQYPEKFFLQSKAGVLFFVLFITVSCDRGKGVAFKEPRIAKTVPVIYINADNNGFVKHEDTIYYQGMYFTGYRFSLYPGGDTAFIAGYFNGVEEGIQK